MLVEVESVQRALEKAEFAKDLSPKVRVLAAEAFAQSLSVLCDGETSLSHEDLLDIRGELRGVLAFSQALDRAIKSGSILEKEEV